MDQPGPDRIQDRLEQEQHRRLERQDVAHPSREEDVGHADLDRSESRHDGPVERPGGLHRQREEEAKEERDQVPHHDRRHRGAGRGVLAPPHPSKTHERERPAESAQRREDVPVHRIGCGRVGMLASDEEEPHAGSHHRHHSQIVRANGLAKEPGREQQDVEGRRGLEKDRVRGGGELVREHEEGHRCGVRKTHQRRARAPASPCLGQEKEQRERRDPGAEAGHLPARKLAGLDPRASDGEGERRGEDAESRSGMGNGPRRAGAHSRKRA